MFHPKHTFSVILKSQLLRFHRICNNESDFEEAVQILFHNLRQRNYTPRFLRHVKNTTLADIKNRSRKEQSAKCQVKRCQACTVFVDFTPINNTKVTQRDKINNCGTSNVVYLITCNACSVSYVGETGNQLRIRLNNHRSDIRHNNDTQVARHFNEAGHSYADLRITILESGPFSDDTSLETIYRGNCESKWITRLKTRQPGGLNITEDSFDIIPFVIRFSHQGKTIAKLAKATYKLLQSVYPDIYTPRFITAFSKNKNL